MVAGISFILPAALMVGALAWAYVRYGSTPAGEALLYGIKPVVVAIIIRALIGLGRTALVDDGRITRDTWLPAVAAVAAGGLYVAGVNELLLLGAGAALVLAARAAHRRLGALGVGLAALWAAAGPVPADAGVAGQLGLGRLFVVFLKVGAVLYGSGYVLLAFLQGDLVVRLGVLTEQQLLDAVAIGQLTPGPVFTTATFVGYLVSGPLGAVVATVGIFLPSFLLVGGLVRILPRIRDRRWSADLLDGVNAAALGLMGGVLVELGGDAVVDAVTAGLLAATGLLLWRTELDAAWLVTGGAAVGLAAAAAGLAP